MEFCCDKCDYSSNRKQNLLRHTCKEPKNLEHKCLYPGCTYSSDYKHHLEQHLIRCKLKTLVTNIDQSTTDQSISIDNSNNSIDNSNNPIDNSINTNNIVNNTINNNIQILLPWDNPLIGFALEQSLDKYLQEVNVHKVSAKDILDNVLRRIYFNPEHPENHSIKMENQRKGLVTVYNGSSLRKDS